MIFNIKISLVLTFFNSFLAFVLMRISATFLCPCCSADYIYNMVETLITIICSIIKQAFFFSVGKAATYNFKIHKCN